MKTQNAKVINLEFSNGTGYFMIDCGRFGQMIFDFDIDFNVDSDYDLESVDVMIGSYDWELLDGGSLKFGQDLRLNKRNTKMICEYIEEIILNDPYSFGFDPEEAQRDDFNFYQDMRFEEMRLSNM